MMRKRVWRALLERWPDHGPHEPYLDLLVEPCIYLHAIQIDLSRLRLFVTLSPISFPALIACYRFSFYPQVELSPFTPCSGKKPDRWPFATA